MSSPVAGNDPYGNFNFRILMDGEYVAGAGLITGIRPPTEADLVAGGTSGHIKYEPVIIEGIVTSDPAFLGWMRIEKSDSPTPAADGDPREIIVEQYTGDNLHATYILYKCWVSEFQAESEPYSGADLVVIELVQLEHEGMHVRPVK